MEKKFTSKASWLVLLACLLLPLIATAQSKPRWVQKGVKAMNKARTNDTYEFISTEAFGADVNTLRREHLKPLVERIADKYELSASSAKIDTLSMAGGNATVADSTAVTTDYRITFTGDSMAVFHARLVDEYDAFEDFADQTYDWTLYRLYAVSGKNVIPIYDDYELTRTYRGAAAALSLIPGLGQIYKGQKAKGFAIMGTEAALIGSVIAFTVKQHRYYRNADNGMANPDSWRSKAHSWKQMRNLGIGLAGGLYIYNLIDAALSKGSRRVIVRKPKGTDMAIAPILSQDGAGLALVLQF